MLRSLIYFAVFVAMALLQNITGDAYAKPLPQIPTDPSPQALTVSGLSNPDGLRRVFGRLPGGMAIGSLSITANVYACSAPVLLTLYDCGPTFACIKPKIVAAQMISIAGTITRSVAASIGAGAYYAWSLSGKCSSIDVSATARAPVTQISHIRAR